MRPLVDSIVECFAVTDLLIQGHVSHSLFHPLPSLPLFAGPRPRSPVLASVAAGLTPFRLWLFQKACFLCSALKFLSGFFIPPVVMNVRDSDGSDSFEGDSVLEDSGSSSRMSNQQLVMAPQSQWKGRRGKPRCDYCRMNKLKVRPPTLTDNPSPIIFSISAIENSLSATTAPGQVLAIASTHRSLRPRIVAFPDAIAVDSGI